jgi:hypothetical protein
MARTIGPGTPTPIKSVDVQVPDMDLSLLDKLGDKKIKSATENFKLYASTASAVESQKAYDQYKNNPIALANALEKLSGMFDELPESIREEMKSKFTTNGISLVQKAQANQEKNIAKQNKAMARANAALDMSQLSDDFFNVLTDITSPEGEKKPVIMDIYRQHRSSLESLMNITDEDGNLLFTETQRAKMLMPKEALVAGFKTFIYRPNLKQLQEWDENIFQNRNKFIEDTGIDSETYDSMEKALTERIKQLQNTDRKIKKTQAEFETAGLLKTGDEMKAKVLEENPDAPKKLVKRAVELNKKIVESHWYDPNRESDPGAVFDMLLTVGKITNDPDTSPDGLEKKIELGLDSIDSTVKNLNKTNMSNEDLENTIDYIYSSIVDQGFVDNVKMLDVTPWVNGVVDARRADMQANSAMYEPRAIEKMDETIEAYHEKGKLAPIEKKAKEYAESTTWKARGKSDRDIAHKLAYDNAKIGIMEVMQYLKATGNVQAAKNMLNQVKYNYVKTYNSNWISGSDFDRLQYEVDNGKKPIYFHNGINWEYQGYQNDGAIFKVKL